MGHPEDAALGVEDEMVDSKTVTVFRTSHGLKVLHIPLPDAKNVVFMFRVLGGSAKETPEQYGMAHFLEHMFFKGTEHRSVQRLHRDLSLCGANWNAFTGQVDVGYYIDVPCENYDKSLELITDMFFNPVFPQKEIDIERGVILEEIKMYKDDPTASFFQSSLEHHFDASFGHAILGPPENIHRFNRGDFVSYRDTHYRSNNITLAVAGNVSLEKLQATLEANTYLSKLPDAGIASPECVRPKDIFSGGTTSAKFYRKNIEQSQMLIGFGGLPMFHEDYFKFSTMLFVLGNGPHSLLWNRIREELGLCYSISAYCDPEIHDDKISLGTVYVGTSPDKVELCQSEILGCMEKLKNADYDDEILECAKQSALGHLSRQANSAYKLSDMYSFAWLFGANPITIDYIIEKLKQVTKNDVTRMGEAFLDPNQFRFSYQYPE